MYDLRMYRHTLGQPLTDADILSIAFEAIPTAAQPQFTNAQCLQITDPKMEDQAWKDVFGNSCDWCKFLSLHFCSLCFHIFTVIAVLVCHPIPPPTFNVFCLPVTRGTVVGDFLIFFIFGLDNEIVTQCCAYIQTTKTGIFTQKCAVVEMFV
jgi:hypothetical protein